MVGLIIPDLNLVQVGLAVLLDVDVDGEMCVDVAHLVLEAAGNTDDQVVDDSADSSESSDSLAGTVVQLNRDDVLLGAAEGDSDVRQVLRELAWNPMSAHDFLPIARKDDEEFSSSVLRHICQSGRFLLRTSRSLNGDNPRTNVNFHCIEKPIGQPQPIKSNIPNNRTPLLLCFLIASGGIPPCGRQAKPGTSPPFAISSQISTRIKKMQDCFSKCSPFSGIGNVSSEWMYRILTVL